MNERTKARSKHWGDLVYRHTPNAISKIVYDMGRASLFKEERQESFMHAFEHIAREVSVRRFANGNTAIVFPARESRRTTGEQDLRLRRPPGLLTQTR